MKIRSEDYDKLLAYLVQQRWAGEEMVAYCESISFSSREGLYTFATSEEAVTFCREMSTDEDQYSYMAIRSTCRVMSEARIRPDTLIQYGGIADVGAMVEKYVSETLENEQSNNNKNLNTMNMANLEYLQEQVKKTGFGDQLHEKIADAVAQQSPEFKLDFETKFGNDKLNAELSFSRSNSTDMYFFNSYRAEVQKDGSDEKIAQTFYINGFENRHNNIYLKEAYNLLCGRCVNKDLISRQGEMYNAWSQIDFKETTDSGNYKMKYYGEKFGYDLEGTLAKHPIKELANDEYKSNLLKSLRKGNLQSVTFQKDGQETKKFIEAVPQFKSINIYDSSMKREGQRQSKEEKEGKDSTQSQKRSESQNVADDSAPDIPQQNKRRNRKQNI